MTRTDLYYAIKLALDDYEVTTRRYLDKVETDRPWVAEAMWEAVWRFRRSVFAAYYTLERELKEARHARPED